MEGPRLGPHSTHHSFCLLTHPSRQPSKIVYPLHCFNSILRQGGAWRIPIRTFCVDLKPSWPPKEFALAR
eukprot:scaffold76276_cov14-Tisochrysis_lutea.AAC.1